MPPATHAQMRKIRRAGPTADLRFLRGFCASPSSSSSSSSFFRALRGGASSSSSLGRRRTSSVGARRDFATAHALNEIAWDLTIILPAQVSNQQGVACNRDETLAQANY